MRINSIKIEDLFGIFTYDISFKQEENILIITGPNGFGKTMILKIIYNLFEQDTDFFVKLDFKKITLQLDEDITILISKTNSGEIVNFSFFESNMQLGKVIRNLEGIKFFDILGVLSSIGVYLIIEDRLFIMKNRSTISTIEVHARELKQLIEQYTQLLFIKTQELDSSYPIRLRAEKNILTEGDYRKRYQNLKQKQEKLAEFGLYENRQEFLEYSAEDAKALTVYIKDIEQKLDVFDVLLEKLDAFTSILNERRFTFKSIKIDKKTGFYFETSKGKRLELNQLSSGEQHEIVLLYELIFNVKPNSLVLIDEPEISLHITWQKEFLTDLQRIINIQNMQVIVATHAPAIINDRWDLVYTLETNQAQ